MFRQLCGLLQEKEKRKERQIMRSSIQFEGNPDFADLKNVCLLQKEKEN